MCLYYYNFLLYCLAIIFVLILSSTYSKLFYESYLFYSKSIMACNEFGIIKFGVI